MEIILPAVLLDDFNHNDMVNLPPIIQYKNMRVRISESCWYMDDVWVARLHLHTDFSKYSLLDSLYTGFKETHMDKTT